MLLFVLFGSLAGVCVAVIGLSEGLSVANAFLIYLAASISGMCLVPLLCCMAYRVFGVTCRLCIGLGTRIARLI